jgi:signal transduction histidine kinase
VKAFHPTRSDVLLPALLGIIGAVEIVASGYAPVWVPLTTYLISAAVLVARCAVPLAMPLLVATIYAATPLLGFDVSEPSSWVLLLVFACFSAGLHAPRSQWVVGLASVAGALAVTLAGLTWLTDFEPSFLFGAIASVGPWALGLALRRALDESRRAGAEVERARLDRALAGPRAVESERRRIAVELHDVLAHSLGAMVVQASVAGDLLRRNPNAAVSAARDVARLGRDAIAETGRLLRLIREPEPTMTTHTEPQSAQRFDSRVRPRDALLPAVLGVIGAAELVVHDYGPLWASIGADALAVLALSARRRAPLAMPIAVAAFLSSAELAGVETSDPASTLLFIALACFSAGRYVPRSRATLGLASVLASIPLLSIGSADLVLALPLVIGPWVVGLGLRLALERTRARSAEAERARVELDLEAERAAVGERRRIARELHDVLANSLSVMIVQASVAADLAERDPSLAATAVAEVERSGRRALGEIGGLLRLIDAGPDDLGRRPQHGVADLAVLAEEYERAGLGVDLEVTDVVGLPIGVELSTYRIVQEGLTNALKHAPGSPVRVHLARRAADVAIEVRNGPASSNAIATVAGGHGLLGLRERVSLFGGSLDARPTDDGGFVLAATIPITDAG